MNCNDADRDPRVAVRVWMARNGKNQGELAEALGVSPSTLSQILSEKREEKRDPSPATAVRIRDLCGVPLDAWYDQPAGEANAAS